MQLIPSTIYFSIRGQELNLESARSLFEDFQSSFYRASDILDRGSRVGQERGEDLVLVQVDVADRFKVSDSISELGNWLCSIGSLIGTIDQDGLNSTRSISIAFVFSGSPRPTAAKAAFAKEFLNALVAANVELNVELFPSFQEMSTAKPCTEATEVEENIPKPASETTLLSIFSKHRIPEAIHSLNGESDRLSALSTDLIKMLASHEKDNNECFVIASKQGGLEHLSQLTASLQAIVQKEALTSDSNLNVIRKISTLAWIGNRPYTRSIDFSLDSLKLCVRCGASIEIFSILVEREHF